MKKFWFVTAFILLPIATALITYSFVGLSNAALQLDNVSGLILCIALIKLAILGGTGIFPINLNKVYKTFLGSRRRRGEDLLYQIPPVAEFPCIRRLICELEAVVKSSDDYLPKEPEVQDHPEEEINPPEQDPMTEIHIESILALYRDNIVSDDISPESRKAVHIMESLTGSACEEAYRKCPGRISAPMFFKLIFDEINLEASNATTLLL